MTWWLLHPLSEMLCSVHEPPDLTGYWGALSQQWLTAPLGTAAPIRKKTPDIFHTFKLLHVISLYFSLPPEDHQCTEAAGEQMRRRWWRDVSLLLSSGKTLLALFGYHLSACPHDSSRLKSHPQCLHGFISIRTEISQNEHKHCCIYCKFCQGYRKFVTSWRNT